MTAKRRISLKRVRKTRSYLVKELALIVDRSDDTVQRWIGMGLPTIGTRRPLLIDGEIFIAWHQMHRSRRQHKCDRDEMFCVKCQLPSKPASDSIELIKKPKLKPRARGTCRKCGTVMNRILGRADLAHWSSMGTASTQASSTLNDVGKPSVDADFKARTDPVQIRFDF